MSEKLLASCRSLSLTEKRAIILILYYVHYTLYIETRILSHSYKFLYTFKVNILFSIQFKIFHKLYIRYVKIIRTFKLNSIFSLYNGTVKWQLKNN